MKQNSDQFLVSRRFVGFAFLGLVGCQSLSHKPAKPEVLEGSTEDIEARLQYLIPAGTPIAEAEQALRELGLPAKSHTDPQSQVTELRAGYSERVSFWVTWHWDICVTCPNGVVETIECRQMGTGP